MEPSTVLETFNAIVEETPYWMREVHGKHLIEKVRKFIKENEKPKPN